VGLTLEGEAFTARRPVYSGKAFAEATTAGKTPQVITLRPNVFAAEEGGGAGAGRSSMSRSVRCPPARFWRAAAEVGRTSERSRSEVLPAEDAWPRTRSAAGGHSDADSDAHSDAGKETAGRSPPSSWCRADRPTGP
jgi:hypothetical protein